MPMLRKSLTLFALLAVLAPSAASADLFLSEYVEGSSNNKAVEIFNPTGAAVDLSDYELRLYSNGSLIVTTTLSLVGILAAGDVFVVANGSAGAALLALADLTSGVANFNGDDAFELYKVSTTSSVDIIGQIGFDPGTAWSAGGVTTLNSTIRRKADVCQGDPIGSDAFDPSVEWDGFAQDDFSDLGSHTNACGPTPTNASTWGRLKSLYR